MTELTEEQLQQLIIAQVGDDAAGTLAAQLAVIWAQYAGAGGALQFLYAKRAAIEVMLARARSQVSFKALDGASVNLSDVFNHLKAMYDLVTDQITEAEATGALPLIGELTTTAPIGPPSELGPDANDPRYRGQPYPPDPTRPGRWPG